MHFNHTPIKSSQWLLSFIERRKNGDEAFLFSIYTAVIIINSTGFSVYNKIEFKKKPVGFLCTCCFTALTQYARKNNCYGR
jgi:hypothetical protein